MKMNVDSVIYQNLEHLLTKNGITERQCVIACGLNLNYFVNYRKKEQSILKFTI